MFLKLHIVIQKRQQKMRGCMEACCYNSNISVAKWQQEHRYFSGTEVEMLKWIKEKIRISCGRPILVMNAKSKCCCNRGQKQCEMDLGYGTHNISDCNTGI